MKRSDVEKLLLLALGEATVAFEHSTGKLIARGETAPKLLGIAAVYASVITAEDAER